MTYRQLISIVVLVAVAVMAVQPGRAEAVDALSVLVIAGVVVLVVFLGVVVVEIVRGRPFHAVDATTDWSLIAFDATTANQTP